MSARFARCENLIPSYSTDCLVPSNMHGLDIISSYCTLKVRDLSSQSPISSPPFLKGSSLQCFQTLALPVVIAKKQKIGQFITFARNLVFPTHWSFLGQVQCSEGECATGQDLAGGVQLVPLHSETGLCSSGCLH